MNSGWWWLVTNWRACFKFQCPFPGWTPAGNHHYFLLLHIVTSMWEPSLRNMLFWSKWGSYVLIIQQVHQFRWTHHPMWDIDNGGCSARVGIYRTSLQLPLNFSETLNCSKICLLIKRRESHARSIGSGGEWGFQDKQILHWTHVGLFPAPRLLDYFKNCPGREVSEAPSWWALVPLVYTGGPLSLGELESLVEVRRSSLGELCTIS